MNVAGKKKSVVVSDSKSTRVIPMEMIIHIEACGPYSLIYNKNGEEIVWSKHLKVVQTFLDAENFIRIHKGHVVNLKEIVKYRRGRGGYVILSNGVELAVAFRRKGEFLERYKAPA
jgi:two-component system LytT family response regulator